MSEEGMVSERVTVVGYWSDIWRRIANWAERRGYFVTIFKEAWRYTAGIGISKEGRECHIGYLGSWRNKDGTVKTRILLVCHKEVLWEVKEFLETL